MSIFQDLRMRWAIWRLEREVDICIESVAFHARMTLLAAGQVTLEKRRLGIARAELERMTAALAERAPA